jgi:uncharacterized membrane protein
MKFAIFTAGTFQCVWQMLLTIWRSRDRAWWYISDNKKQITKQILKFILEWNCTCLGQFFCPSSAVFTVQTAKVYVIPVSWQLTSRIRIELNLIGFIIRNAPQNITNFEYRNRVWKITQLTLNMLVIPKLIIRVNTHDNYIISVLIIIPLNSS